MVTIAGVDIETTGIEPGDHRMVELYVGLWELETRTLKRQFLQRIDPQRSIMAAATAVHHITASDLVGKPIWPEVAGAFRDILDSANMIVAHNGKEFDLPFINYELERIGLKRIEKPLVDTMVDARWATFQGKLPTLGELCFACELPYDTTPGKAHAADFDVRVTMECFFRGLDWGFFSLPELPAAPSLALAA